MKNAIMLISLFVVLSLSFSGCTTTGPNLPPEDEKVVEFKAPEVGSVVEWKIVRNGEESIEQATLHKEEIDGKPVYFWKSPTDDITSIYDVDSMNWMGRWSHQKKEWLETAKPNNGSKQFPLWAGKSYTANYLYSKKGGWSGRVNSWVKVKGWEKTTVPAGSYETLRIEQKGKNFSTVTWYSPDLRINIKFKVTNRRGTRSGELLTITKP